MYKIPSVGSTNSSSFSCLSFVREHIYSTSTDLDRKSKTVKTTVENGRTQSERKTDVERVRNMFATRLPPFSRSEYVFHPFASTWIVTNTDNQHLLYFNSISKPDSSRLLAAIHPSSSLHCTSFRWLCWISTESSYVVTLTDMSADVHLFLSRSARYSPFSAKSNRLSLNIYDHSSVNLLASVNNGILYTNTRTWYKSSMRLKSLEKWDKRTLSPHTDG